MHLNGKTIIELPDSISGVPLVLGYSVKIHPGGHLTVPLECTRPVTDRISDWISSFTIGTPMYIYTPVL